MGYTRTGDRGPAAFSCLARHLVDSLLMVSRVGRILAVTYALVTPAVGADRPTPAEWWLPFPPETLVTIESVVGKFRLPIGYVTEPLLLFPGDDFLDADRRARTAVVTGLPDHPEIKSPFKHGFNFQFWMPDGKFVYTNTGGYSARPRETGHPHPQPTEFVVKVDMMKALSDEQHAADRVLHPKGGPGKLFFEKATIRPPGYYHGAIHVNSTEETVGVSFDCIHNISYICGGMMYFDKQKLVLRYYMTGERLADTLAAAAKASELLASWRADRAHR